jgi:lipopolysaccharide export system permease protein
VSVTTAFYLTRIITVRILAVLIGIAALAVCLDLVENATDIISRHGAGRLFEYAMLRLPLIVLTVLPLCVLIGAVLGFLTLAMRSEMVVLRAAGLNTLRMLLLLAPLCLALGAVHNLLASWLAPAAEIAMSERFPSSSDARKLTREVWMRDWGAVIRVGGASDGATLISDVTIFELDDNGRLARRIDAAAAEFTGDGWLMQGVRVRTGQPLPEELDRMLWQSRLTPSRIASAARRSEMVGAAEVREILSGEVPGGRGMPFYSMQLWNGYAAFLTPVVMLLFGSLAGFGLARSGGGARYVAISALGGSGFILLDGVFTSLGEVGAVPAVPAAFLAPALFMVLGIWTVVLAEE